MNAIFGQTRRGGERDTDGRNSSSRRVQCLGSVPGFSAWVLSQNWYGEKNCDEGNLYSPSLTSQTQTQSYIVCYFKNLEHNNTFVGDNWIKGAFPIVSILIFCVRWRSGTSSSSNSGSVIEWDCRHRPTWQMATETNGLTKNSPRTHPLTRVWETTKNVTIDLRRKGLGANRFLWGEISKSRRD